METGNVDNNPNKVQKGKTVYILNNVEYNAVGIFELFPSVSMAI